MRLADLPIGGMDRQFDKERADMIKKLMTAAALLAMAGAASAATLYTTGVLDFNKTTKGMAS